MSVIHDALHKAGDASLGGMSLGWVNNLRERTLPFKRPEAAERRLRGKGPWPLMVLVFIGMLSVGSVTALAIQSTRAIPVFPGIMERTGLWFRDTLGHNTGGSSQYVVNGIILGEQSSAIINGELVSVGSVIGNAVVADISSKKVILREGTKEILLAY